MLKIGQKVKVNKNAELYKGLEGYIVESCLEDKTYDVFSLDFNDVYKGRPVVQFEEMDLKKAKGKAIVKKESSSNGHVNYVVKERKTR